MFAKVIKFLHYFKLSHDGVRQATAYLHNSLFSKRRIQLIQDGFGQQSWRSDLEASKTADESLPYNIIQNT